MRLLTIDTNDIPDGPLAIPQKIQIKESYNSYGNKSIDRNEDLNNVSTEHDLLALRFQSHPKNTSHSKYSYRGNHVLVA